MKDLGTRFPIEDKGELSWILNVAITRNRDTREITLSQSLYISDLLQRHESFIGENNTRSFDAPLGETLLDPADSPEVGSPEYDAMAPRREAYMAIVGGLLWLANMSRPDLAYAASQLSRFMTNPGATHFHAAVRALIYLRGSKDRVLHFAPNPKMSFVTFVDSNWEAKYSCSGALFFFYGCPIQWFSKMQRSVSLSSAEAEYFGAMLTAKDLIFIRDLITDLGILLNGPSIVYSDSKSAVDMAFDPVAFKKTEHILRAGAFLRDLVAKQVLTLKHVKGHQMVADILTKPCPRNQFHRILQLLDSFSSSTLCEM